MAVKRILALLVAVGMVVGAQALRDRIEDPAVAGDPGDRPRPGGAGDVVLVCDPGLDAVCQAIAEQADVEAVALAPGEVADRLAGPTGQEFRGAWLTLAPWVEVAALHQQPAGGVAAVGEATVLARSPLVVAVWEDRAGVLASHCGTVTWRCVGDAAAGTWADIGGDEAWGPVKLGRADGAGSSEGMLVLGQIAAGYAGRADLTRADVGDDAFFTWLRRMEDARPPLPAGAGSPIEAMVVRGAAELDIAGVLEAQAAPFLARTAARAPSLRLRAIEPLATADLVVAAVGDGDEAGALASQVTRVAPPLLAEAGWRAGGEDVAPALEQVGVSLPEGLPSSAGLPPAGTLLALQQLAEEVGR